MGIYKFDRQDAYRFFQEQGLTVSRQSNRNELTALWCPYCHGGGRDKSTFSISMATGQFECKRAKCGAKGNMLTLHKDFGFDLGTDVREYERPSYSWRRFKTPEQPVESSDPAVKYLTGRKISEEVIRRYEITTRKDADNILVFPFYNEAGELEFVKYRKTDFDKEKDNNKEWCERDCRAILFGMKQCVEGLPLIITEGQIDSLSVATAGFNNAVSVPTGKNGMTWVPHCWDWMQQFKEIIVFGDYENGEMTLLEDIRSRFSKATVKAVQTSSYKGCKDANELLMKFGVDAIKEAIEESRPILNKRVMVLSDVSYCTDDSQKLATGIKKLDKVLNGGLPFGEVTVCTGKRGDGKTTMTSMLAKAAIEQGYNVMIYSGELRTGDVKKWLDLQIAGPDRIIAEKNGDFINFHLSQQNIARINRWYSDKVFIYNNTILDDDDEEDVQLLQIIKDHAIQFGCKVMIIDNIMTAIDLEPENVDKYERQSRMCKKLARFAQATNSVIILVAHQKKSDGTADMNDMVSGTGDITNLAGTVISYSRGGSKDDIADDQRLIRVLKNRRSGVCEFKGIITNFDQASKRVYGDDDYDLRMLHYSKCFDSDEFEPITDSDVIPF